MNPIARLPADPLPEPRGESPTPGATGDADSAEFGLALALAAAAQSQAAVVPRATPVVAPAPIPSGDARDSAAAAATGTLAGNVTDALVTVPLPAPSASAPVPARPEPVRPPAVPSGNADAPATPVAAEAATVVRDAPPRTADLPLTIRVLEFVRGVTEQAARAALDTATSAGPAQAPDADERGRGRPGESTRDGEGPARAVGAMLAESPAAARASQADESAPAFAGTGSSVPQGVRLSAASVDPAAGDARAAAVPPEARTSARPGDQITLHFSGEDGLEGQLRVSVRGQNVRATILADDPVTAERFSRGLDGLQRALLDRGFSEARLNVQQTARSEGRASGNVPRDGDQGDSQPRGESRDRYSSSRQERESAFPEDRPDRRQSRQRTER